MAQNLEAIYPTIAWRRGSWHGCESRICEPGAGPLLLAQSPGSGRAQRPGNALKPVSRCARATRTPDPPLRLHRENRYLQQDTTP